MKSRLVLAFAGVVAASWVHPAAVSQSRVGTVEVIQVHGRSLEGNLAGDSPSRRVSVYLPPSYHDGGARRYPVLYLLHGYNDEDGKWFGRERHFVSVPEVVERAANARGARELLVVMADSQNRFGGSMYSSSITIGDWEAFIVRDLVSFIDGRYRTLAAPDSRGLAGHSMGGYGALKLALKHPGVFSSIYALNPCCLIPSPTRALTKVESLRTLEDFDAADFVTRADVAAAAAWSPNPASPPFFADMWTKGGVVQPMVFARWTANAPLAMLDQYVGNLRQLRAIAFDAADNDISRLAENAEAFSRALRAYNIPHTFEIYNGTHVSGVAERVEKHVLPFFWSNLTF